CTPGATRSCRLSRDRPHRTRCSPPPWRTGSAPPAPSGSTASAGTTPASATGTTSGTASRGLATGVDDGPRPGRPRPAVSEQLRRPQLIQQPGQLVGPLLPLAVAA